MIGLLAVLAIIAQVAVLAVVGAWLVQRFSSAHPFDRIVALVGADAIRLAALVAIIATAGSLYFSEVRDFAPCHLCWLQRIAMYPLVVLLGIAAIINDRRIGRYVLPLAGLGSIVSIFHIQLERFPDQKSVSCDIAVPCTTIWFQEFGYITIPVLALSAFALIATLVWLGGRYGQGISIKA